jgi:hypothetical protein
MEEMMKKIYIALNSFAFGTAQVIAMSEDAEILASTYSPCFTNGSIPAFNELSQDEEYIDKYKKVYGDDYEFEFIKDFNYPKEYKEIVNKYNSNH